MRLVKDLSLLNYYIKKNKIDSIISNELLQKSILYSFEKNEIIIKTDEELKYYYFFVNGKIQISYSYENGKKMPLKIYKSFQSFGDIEIIKNKPILCNIEALEDSYFILLPADFVRQEYKKNIEFAQYFAENLSDKFYATIKNSSYTYVYPLINRLSSYLLELDIYDNKIQLKSSFILLAESLGTTYRHLNRVFKEMEKEKILMIKKKVITILDLEELKNKAKDCFINF